VQVWLPHLANAIPSGRTAPSVAVDTSEVFAARAVAGVGPAGLGLASGAPSGRLAGVEERGSREPR